MTISGAPRDDLIATMGSLMLPYLAEGQTLAEELALLSVQPGEKQASFAARLREIDSYLALEKRGNEAADAAALRLGVQRRQFLRLVAKLKEVGPVRALVPKLQNATRPSAVRDGLGEQVEEILSKILAAEPDAKLTSVQKQLDEQLPPSVPRPGWGSLRRRLQVLRGTKVIGRTSGSFGESLIVDQSSTTMPVRATSRDPDYAVVTFVVDRATTLVLGGAISTYDNIGTGVRTALASAEDHFLPKLKDHGFPVASALSRLEWVVPPGLEMQVTEQPEVVRPKSLEIVIHNEGARRHGDLLLRTIGDRLGPYRLRVRQTTNLESAARPGGAALHIDEATDLLYKLLDEHNRSRIEQLVAMDEYRPDSDPATRATRLRRVVKTLVKALEHGSRLPFKL
jgi:hypothetical protein